MPSADVDRVDRATRSLARELKEVGVGISAPTERPTSGTKGDPVTLGCLALAVLPGLLPALVTSIQAWCLRTRQTVKLKGAAGNRTLELEFSPDLASQSDVERLLLTAARFLDQPAAGEKGSAQPPIRES